MVRKSGGSGIAAIKTAIVPFGLWGMQRLARKKHNRRSIKRVGKKAKGLTRKTYGLTRRTLKRIVKLPINTLKRASKIVRRKKKKKI